MSLSGSGEINKNQPHIESLWSDSAGRWFHEGPESINLALIKFSPYTADCLDASKSKMMRLFNMYSSLIPRAPMQIVSALGNETEPLTNLQHRKILWEIKL